MRVNERIAAVDLDGSDMLLTTATGRQIRIYHVQDCCEDVVFHDGDWRSVRGRVVKDVTVQHEPDDDPSFESATWSVVTFELDEGAEVLRWHGSSNGYYSETVDLDFTDPGDSRKAVG